MMNMILQAAKEFSPDEINKATWVFVACPFVEVDRRIVLLMMSGLLLT